MSGYDSHGAPLVEGYNVDRVDVEAGVRQAQAMGYASTGNEVMLVQYALWRHGNGEEDGAQKTALSGGIDLTSWYMILAAAARAAAEPEMVATDRALAEKRYGRISALPVAETAVTMLEGALGRIEALAVDPALDRMEQSQARSVVQYVNVALNGARLLPAALRKPVAP